MRCTGSWYCLGLVLVCGLYASALAQTPLAVSLSGEQAWLYAQNPKMNHQATWSRGVFLDASWQTSGNRPWQHAYNLPRLGVSLGLQDFGYQFNGEVLSLIPYIDFVLLRTNRFGLFFRQGIGAAFHTRPFDAESNPENVAIGTHWNFGVRLGPVFHWRIAQQWELTGSLQLCHYSQGNHRRPNLGFNPIGLTAGATYWLADAPEFRPQVGPKPKAEGRKWQVQGGFSLATKEFDHLGYMLIREQRYAVSLNVWRRMGYRSRVGAGFEAFWHPENPKQPIGSRDRQFNTLRVGHELLLGKLGLQTMWGFYLLPTPYPEGYVYQSIGLFFYPHPNLYIGPCLKTHFARSDFIQWQLGFQF